jgi:hypothetical protein
MLIEPDWPSMMVDRGEKITSFKLTKYDFSAAYLDTRFLLRRMQTRITAAEENGYTLRLD